MDTEQNNELEEKIQLGQAINIANAWYCKATNGSPDLPSKEIFTEMVFTANTMLEDIKAEFRARKHKQQQKDETNEIEALKGLM